MQTLVFFMFRYENWGTFSLRMRSQSRKTAMYALIRYAFVAFALWTLNNMAAILKAAISSADLYWINDVGPVHRISIMSLASYMAFILFLFIEREREGLRRLIGGTKTNTSSRWLLGFVLRYKRYHSTETENIPAFIYWGKIITEWREFGDKRKTQILK